MKTYEQRNHQGGKGDVYAYDGVSRLTGITFDAPDPTASEVPDTGKSWTAAYDGVDNILSMVNLQEGKTKTITPHIPTNSVYEKLNQYATFGGPLLEYDENGNTARKGRLRFYYDYRNQLVRVVEGIKSTQYTYDVMGRRISKSSDGQVTRYFYSGNRVIEERDGSGNILKQYIYGNGIDELLRIDVHRGGTVTSYFVHTNAAGSVTAITDADGNLIERVAYDAFGNASFTDANGASIAVSSIGNEILFQGRRYDKESNLYYYRARHYDPVMGRFLQNDPMGYHDSMNLYQAFNMNGVNFVDPMGEDVEIIVGRPYRDRKGKWHPYGHVAIRIYAPITKEYDKAYDFGRYSRTWGIANSMGEGILNVSSGIDYLKRETRLRNSVVYRIKTNSVVDKRIINYYLKQIKNGKRRKDLEARLRYPNTATYQLQKSYDAAVLTSWGRNTCVTKSGEGCKASGLESLKEIIFDALDELYPENVEENLEEAFQKKDSPIIERRFYKNRNYSIPIIVSHQVYLQRTDEEKKKEKAARETAWSEE